ncbi:MAG: arylsulfatase [Melioribacteraceae bacterium]|nr:arylsulfatase [Melioribacteraceae bacterium]MCF8262904.1 arylsulfatase [Melioribacteraceae bacterium]
MEINYTRRNFLKTTGMATVGLMAAQKANFASFSKSNKKPNVIYILADDLGYGDLSCYGQDKFKTKNIDKLANEGMRFTQHYSGSTVCAPSRCCLMTGFHSGHTTIRDNFDKNNARVSLRKTDVTVAKVLRDAGYKTGIIGKWGLGEPGTEGTPNKHGFDYWFGFLNQANAHSYYPEYIWRNEEKEHLPGNLNGDRKSYVHDLFTKEALNFIKNNKDEPFFLYLPYTIPHSDLDVPEDSLDLYKGKYPEQPYKDDEFQTDSPRAAYAAMISRMDKDIGEISKLLKKLNIDENTLVIFTSDNGPSPKNGGDPNYFNSSGPFKGGKRDLYEGGIRVPFIARWPGKINPNSFSHHVSTFWDFFPTMVELSESDYKGDTDGISFLPSLTGKSQKEHDYVYWEFTIKGESYQAARKDDWKILRSAKGYEFYNLRYDPRELFEVSHLYEKEFSDLKLYLKTARQDNPDYNFYLE